jgi:hypothetical protein
MSLRVSWMSTQLLQEKNGYLRAWSGVRQTLCERSTAWFLDVPSERTVGVNFRTEFTMILGPIPAEASSFFGCRGVFDNSIPTSIPDAPVRYSLSPECGWGFRRVLELGASYRLTPWALPFRLHVQPATEIDLRRRSQEQRFLRDCPETNSSETAGLKLIGSSRDPINAEHMKI